LQCSWRYTSLVTRGVLRVEQVPFFENKKVPPAHRHASAACGLQQVDVSVLVLYEHAHVVCPQVETTVVAVRQHPLKLCPEVLRPKQQYVASLDRGFECHRVNLSDLELNDLYSPELVDFGTCCQPSLASTRNREVAIDVFQPLVARLHRIGLHLEFICRAYESNPCSSHRLREFWKLGIYPQMYGKLVKVQHRPRKRAIFGRINVQYFIFQPAKDFLAQRQYTW
jgi:hypothetical protein